MTSRRRKAATSRATTSETITDTESSAGGDVERTRQRSPSPLNISRIEEKEEISHLNDRLASYIEYVRSLEDTKEVLTHRIDEFTSRHEVETLELKKEFEGEMISLRNALDDANNAKIEATLGFQKAQNEATEAKKARRIAEENAKKLESNLEKETLARHVLENRLQSLQEEYEFQTRIASKETSQLRKSCVIDVQDISRTVSGRQPFDAALAEEIHAYREQTAIELEEYRAKLEEGFQQQLKSLQNARMNDSNDAVNLRSELTVTKQQYESAKSQIDELKSRCNRLHSDLEAQKIFYEEQLRLKNEVEEALRKELADKITDCTELLAIKVALDQEILAYRKLLESEEGRLHITPPRRESSFSRTTRRSGAVKRRRIDSEIGSEKISSQSRGLGRISIETVDTKQFDFIRIKSESDEDINIGNWTLSYNADGELKSYAFQRNLTIAPLDKITIWSSKSSHTHDPPYNILMKNVDFIAGKVIKVELRDNDGVEQAGLELQINESDKRQSRSFRDENCSMM